MADGDYQRSPGMGRSQRAMRFHVRVRLARQSGIELEIAKKSFNLNG